eukprot:IDg11849t1
MATEFSSRSQSFTSFEKLAAAAHAAAETLTDDGTAVVVRNVRLRGIVGRRRRVCRYLAFVDIFEPEALVLRPRPDAVREKIVSDVPKRVPLVWLEVKLHSSTLLDAADDVRKLLINGNSCALGALIELSGDAHAETKTGWVMFIARSIRRRGVAADALHASILDNRLLNRTMHARNERTMLGWRTISARTEISESEDRLRDICRLWMQVASDVLLRQHVTDASMSIPVLPYERKGGPCANELYEVFQSSELVVAFCAARVVSHDEEAVLLASGEVALARCKLRHWWSTARERSQAIKNASEKEAARASANDPDDPHMNKATKGRRASLFADWLETTFGHDVLLRNDGVFDVAGGRGAVSFELFNKRGISCVLIEPRERKLSREQYIWL